MKTIYKQRIADRLLVRKLSGKGAVVIEGAKWCGKTTTAEQVAKSVLYMSETGKTERWFVCLSSRRRSLCRSNRMFERLDSDIGYLTDNF